MDYYTVLHYTAKARASGQGQGPVTPQSFLHPVLEIREHGSLELSSTSYSLFEDFRTHHPPGKGKGKSSREGGGGKGGGGKGGGPQGEPLVYCIILYHIILYHVILCYVIV